MTSIINAIGVTQPWIGFTVRYNYYATYQIVKKKIESFSSRFSIFYDLLSEDYSLVTAILQETEGRAFNLRLASFFTVCIRRVN